MKHRVASVCFVALTGSTLEAQSVWNVPIAADVTAVIAAASPGDILVLQAGPGSLDYSGFQVTKGVTIRGNGARVGGVATSAYVSCDVPAGQVAHLQGLNLTVGHAPLPSIPINYGCRLYANSGTVRIESCSFGQWGPVVVIGQADVTMLDCTVSLTAGPCVSVTNGRLALRDCSLSGGNATCDPHSSSCWIGWIPARSSLTLVGATLHAERVSLSGGNHMLSQVVGDGASAMTASNSTVWLADSALSAGSSTNGVSLPALVNVGSTAVAMRQVQLVAGAPAGSASSGLVNPNAPLVRLALSTPWIRGSTSTLTVRGEPGGLYGLWLAPDASGTTLPFAAQPALATNGAPVSAGVLSSIGDASHLVAVPSLPALLNATFWCQAVGVGPLPWQLSTIAGGLVR